MGHRKNEPRDLDRKSDTRGHDCRSHHGEYPTARARKSADIKYLRKAATVLGDTYRGAWASQRSSTSPTDARTATARSARIWRSTTRPSVQRRHSEWSRTAYLSDVSRVQRRPQLPLPVKPFGSLFGGYVSRVLGADRRGLVEPTTTWAFQKELAQTPAAADLFDVSVVHVCVVGDQIPNGAGPESHAATRCRLDQPTCS
jgi:hypothetical protein